VSEKSDFWKVLKEKKFPFDDFLKTLGNDFIRIKNHFHKFGNFLANEMVCQWQWYQWLSGIASASGAEDHRFECHKGVKF
jgi:hypothetical protein